ncbi:MAG: hypothetical protein B7Z16_05590 [Algoriphagus sp. 32-45-6]|nr:MAG: hypothetical protein B7Z16_05590 [Algoriphagus sp. 32-45-6]
MPVSTLAIWLILAQIKEITLQSRGKYALIAGMKSNVSPVFLLSFLGWFALMSSLSAQEIPKMVWKVNRINLGTILEEQGYQTVDFEFTFNSDSVGLIQDIWLECGCTTVDYLKDSLRNGAQGKISITFDPTSAAGFFSRLIVVKGNLEGMMDSLFIEGTAIPYPSQPEQVYSVKKQNLGFRLRKINMGDVFDNEPKVKYVEFFNFGDQVLVRQNLTTLGPEYIELTQVQEMIRPQERGLFQIIYDGKLKNDLGYFEDELDIIWANADQDTVKLEIIADLFQYFPPVLKEDLASLPQLLIEKKEVDLGEISNKSVIRRTVNLTNPGKSALEIKKIQGNCECLRIEVEKNEILPGETVELSLIFDPIGRKGIDQRNIYLFTNDPVNPVQLVVLKSRIE